MTNERTTLRPDEETAFRAWAEQNDIRDVDNPASRYDYRGYWKQIAAKGGDKTQMYEDGRHFTDQFKQHGHPTFSVESQYSAGPHDGGRWVGESFVPPGADMLHRSGAAPRMGDDMLAKALTILSRELAK